MVPRCFQWLESGRGDFTEAAEVFTTEHLRDAVHCARRPFKAVLNDALRAGLDPARTQTRPKAYRVPARSLRLRAGLDPAGLNRLVDDLEADVAAVRAT